MAQAGDTLLSRKSQGVLQVNISAASLANASDTRPAAEIGPTSLQGRPQTVSHYLFRQLSSTFLHVKTLLNESRASSPDFPQLQSTDVQHCRGSHKNEWALFLCQIAQCTSSAQALHRYVGITEHDANRFSTCLHHAARRTCKSLQLRCMCAAVYRQMSGPWTAALQRKDCHAWMPSCGGMQPS